MISLKNITEEELRRYYYLEGQISGKAKNINILNGIQQDYVGSCINNFITWNDDCNKSKFELYIKENLPKIEEQYILQKELLCKQEKEKEKMRENEKKIKIMEYLSKLNGRRPFIHRIQDVCNYQTILEKYNISIYEYEEYKKNKLEKARIRNTNQITETIMKNTLLAFSEIENFEY
jgi:hypothetical protein